MNFANVTALTIPDGVVLRILKGDEVLWSKSALPSEYQQVEYLQTDSNGYFDTGVNASNYSDGIRYVFRGNVTAYQSTSNIYWFGALESSCRSGNVGTLNGYLAAFCGGNGNYYYRTTQPTAGEDFEFIFQGTSLASNDCIATLNGTQLVLSSTLANSAMPNANIYLLTARGTSAASTSGRKFYGKVYSFTMDAVDGTPIRNFVPCYRKSDNVPGMYDTVTGAFFTNAGSGSFTVGADV